MEGTKNSRSANASMEQKHLLVEFVKQHPKLITGKFSNTFTMRDAQGLWSEIADVLNSCGGGASRDWKSWRKTWHDLRCRTRSKFSKGLAYQRGTGGGPYKEGLSGALEKEVADVIKLVTVEGHLAIEEAKSNPIEYDYCAAGPSHQEDLVVESTELTLDTEEQSAAETMLFSPKLPADNKFPKSPRKKVFAAAEAAENYKISLIQKNELKEKYYHKKLELLERQTVAKEQSAAAKMETADALRRCATALEAIAETHLFIDDV